MSQEIIIVTRHVMALVLTKFKQMERAATHNKLTLVAMRPQTMTNMAKSNIFQGFQNNPHSDHPTRYRGQKKCHWPFRNYPTAWPRVKSMNVRPLAFLFTHSVVVNFISLFCNES